jgi:hypothetical protein
VNKKSTDKMSHIILFSSAWCVKLKSGTMFGYYDVHNKEDFIVKWLKSLIEVAAEVERDNKYVCIDYNMNFLINILYDQPNHHVESIIGNLIYFKQMAVRTADGKSLKFFDAINYVPPQTLDSPVKTFGDKKNLQRKCLHMTGLTRATTCMC